MSIPRLELQAALLGPCLAESISKVLANKIDRKVFWSDSKTGLCRLKSDPRNYNVFVSNKLGEIDTLTDTSS